MGAFFALLAAVVAGVVPFAETFSGFGHPATVTVALVLVINNAAAAVVMVPIGINVAGQLGVNTDPFLMAIAIGASCAFLTPIGHQNNTLILRPGGYHFGDYLRMGSLLEFMVVGVGIPMLLWVSPL